CLGLLWLLLLGLGGRGLRLGLGWLGRGLLGRGAPVPGGEVVVPAGPEPVDVFASAELHLAPLVRRDAPLVRRLGVLGTLDVLGRGAIIAGHRQLQDTVAVIQLEDVLDRALPIRPLADHYCPVMVL